MRNEVPDTFNSLVFESSKDYPTLFIRFVNYGDYVFLKGLPSFLGEKRGCPKKISYLMLMVYLAS